MKPVWACTLAVSLLAAGCATERTRLVFTGDPIVDGRNAIQSGPPRDRVMWEDRMVAAAMRRGLFDDAKVWLDEVLPRIGGIIANDSDAKKARGLFHAESKKSFIGEPYERVMAYYYRGVLYWRDGELDNARACFRSAQFQDADTENKTYAADYVLLDYLDGFCTAKLGADGSDCFKRAQGNAKTSVPPPYYPKANVMVFLEFGHGPLKFATGEYAQELRFRPGAVSARSVLLRLGPQSFPLVAYDDLYFQATTRGGRAVDHILANKAVFKKTTDIVGDAAMISGLALASTGDHNEAAAIVGGLGLLTKIVSAATVATADVREWDNLPQYLSFAALELPPGTHELFVDFLDGSGRTLVTKKATFTIVDPKKDTVVFVSEMNN